MLRDGFSCWRTFSSGRRFELLWTLPFVFFEGSGETEGVLITHLLGYLRHAQVFLQEELFGSSHAQLGDPFHGRNLNLSFDTTKALAGGAMHEFSDALDGPRFVELGVDVLPKGFDGLGVVVFAFALVDVLVNEGLVLLLKTIGEEVGAVVGIAVGLALPQSV